MRELIDRAIMESFREYGREEWLDLMLSWFFSEIGEVEVVVLPVCPGGEAR